MNRYLWCSWLTVAVAVRSGAVCDAAEPSSQPAPSSQAADANKDAGSQTLTGVLASKGEDWILVKSEPDPQQKVRCETADKALIAAIEKLVVPSRVKVVWKVNGEQKALVSVETVGEAANPAVEGVVTAKGPNWIEIKLPSGNTNRYQVYYKSKPAEMIAAIAKTEIGKRVRIEWLYHEHYRVIKLEQIPDESPGPAQKATDPGPATKPTDSAPAKKAAAADWPQWRGPTRNGLAPPGPKLAESWPEGGPVKVWDSVERFPNAQTGGMSSVSVANGKAYVYINESGAKDKTKTAKDIILCLDAQTGKTIWKKVYPGLEYEWSASGTITIENGRLYLAGSNRCLYCLDANTGKTIGQMMMGEAVGRVSSSILMQDDRAIVLAMHLAAFDIGNSDVVWCQKKVPEVLLFDNSPVMWASGGKKYVLCNTGSELGESEKVYCVAPESGEILWCVPGGGYSTVVCSDDIMVVETLKKLIAYRISPSGATELWSAPLGANASSPIIYEGQVYVATGKNIACVDLQSGHVMWKNALGEGGGKIDYCSPIIADGKIIHLVGGDGCLVMVKATPDKFVLLAKAKLDVDWYTSPALADGRLYLRMNDRISCFDLREKIDQ